MKVICKKLFTNFPIIIYVIYELYIICIDISDNRDGGIYLVFLVNSDYYLLLFIYYLFGI